jgi:hypothetical protein
MGRLKDEAGGQGFQAVFASVADVTSESAFITRMYAAVQAIPEGKELMARSLRDRFPDT